jgi:hypothetical protein
MGTIIYLVGQAVATLPAAFVDATVASTLSVVGGALSFAWTLINNSKKPNNPKILRIASLLFLYFF